jgi:hypothetical protein
VVCAIEPGVEHAELACIRRKRASDLEVWERTLQAAVLLRPLMPDGARQALLLLEDAHHRDSAYPWALALQAWCHHVIYSRGGLDPARRHLSVAAARSALSTGADDAQVLATAGLVLWFDAHELKAAFALFDRALAVSPSSFLALAASSVALAWSGHAALADERAQRRSGSTPSTRYATWHGSVLPARACSRKTLRELVKPRRGPSKPIQASAFRSPTCAQPRCTAAKPQRHAIRPHVCCARSRASRCPHSEAWWVSIRACSICSRARGLTPAFRSEPERSSRRRPDRRFWPKAAIHAEIREDPIHHATGGSTIS